MGVDATLLARIQFGFTIGFHILWPAYTIGIASYIALMNGLWVRTGKPVYYQQLRFWLRIFAAAFGMGVVTGVVLSYQVGTNWSRFASAGGNVLGPLFSYEVLTAFFLEAGFIGIMLFGLGRVSKKLHLFASIMVAIGTMFSAFWILSANSWMQTPAGYSQLPDGRYVVADWWAAIFNPSFPFRFMHMVTASFVTGAFVVIGVSAFYLWQGKHRDFAKVSFSLSMWAALILVPLQIFLGDLHGLNTREYQPTKLAAIEARWDTARGVPLTLFAWPNMAEERNDYEIELPHVGSLILTHEWNGEVKGLKDVPPSDRPYAPIAFFAFRIMAGIGFALLFIALCGAFLRWREKLFDARWFHGICVLAMPLGFIAVIAGWLVTETGRQPWTIYGLLRTTDAASPVVPQAVSVSLALFVVVYNLLLCTFLFYGAKMVLKGPDDLPPAGVADPAIKPGIDIAAAE